MTKICENIKYYLIHVIITFRNMLAINSNYLYMYIEIEAIQIVLPNHGVYLQY